MRGGSLTYRFADRQRLTMQVLVVAGGRDASVGRAPQERFAHSLPKGTFVAYQHAGHFVYLDEPDRFAQDLVTFLDARAVVISQAPGGGGECVSLH
jgi:pimeloyl-ACP methyl ester carboxylesterase